MKDLFSKSSDQYKLFRPVYPDELFRFICSFVDQKKTAWDCATGNGQAAVELARYFDNVIATDISEQQLKSAIIHPSVEYRKEAAENSSILSESVDLITIAQAYHWFNFPAFIREANRVLKPGAVIAVWCYTLPVCNDEKVNSIIQTFYKDITGPYWDVERRYIDEKYDTVPFPFSEIQNPGFSIHSSWNKQQLTGYLNTWSAVTHYKEQQIRDPLDLITDPLNKVWNNAEPLSFNFPVYLRIGKKSLTE